LLNAVWRNNLFFRIPVAESLFQIPQKLCIAIVAPAGYAPDEDALSRGIAALTAQGCRVKSYYDSATKYQRFGGTDEARAAQIHAAASDPDVKIVLALRGGYGMSRILPQLDFNLLARSGKLFVGHSDITALHLGLLSQANAISFAGPMICDDFTRNDASEFTMQHFWQCLTNPAHSISVATENSIKAEVTGTLWGGNLAILTHLIGTPYVPQIDRGILFVEDINEHPYRIERMMLQLLHSGVLAKQKAILMGDFSGYRLSDYDNGYNFDAMLAYLRSQLSIPVITGLPFGHIRDKVTLAVGAQAKLTVQRDGWQLSMQGYPSLA
jgi:muramoyltetrapeptide carboxypeptidase